MQIPKKFKLGDAHYGVSIKRSLPRGIWGRCWLDSHHIEIATHWQRKPRPTTGSRGTGVTFWHEVTHAILHDMGNALYNDEAFVTAFSKKLGQVIETSEL
jgi:hypothetical protein